MTEDELFRRLHWCKISYFAEGKHLGDIVSQIAPTLQDGQYLELQLPMTARDRVRAPQAEAKSVFYVVDMIHPIIKQTTDDGPLVMEYEVLLSKPPEIPERDDRPFHEILRELRRDRRKNLDSRR